MSTDLERAVLDYLSHLGVERGLADNTLHSYRRDLRRYTAHLHGRGIETPGAIAETDVLGVPRRAAHRRQRASGARCGERGAGRRGGPRVPPVLPP